MKDKRMLARAGIEIPDKYHVDLQDLFQLKPEWDDKVGKSRMAEVIVDKEYGTIKDQFPKERDNYWECKPLDKINLKYAALGPSDDGHGLRATSHFGYTCAFRLHLLRCKCRRY